MKRLWKYTKGYRRQTFAAPFMKLGEALLELFVPILVAEIIDKGVGEGGDPSLVWRMCGLMVLCGAVGMALSLTSQYFSAQAAVGFSCALRRDLFKHLLYLPREEADKAGASALLTRLTADVDRVQNGLNLGLRLLLRSPFIVFGAVVMAYITDPEMSLIFVLAVPALAVIVFAIILLGIPMFAKVQAKLDRLTRHTRDNLRGVRVIRAFNHEDEQVDSFDEANDAHSKESIFAGGVSSLLNPLTYIIVNIAIIMIVKNGGLAVDSGRLTQGQIIALWNYMSQILVELVKLANLIVTLTKAGACAKRISGVLALPLESDEEHEQTQIDQSAPAIEFCSVSFRYRDSKGNSLSNISFELAAGKRLGVLGGTGSGKTTLIDLIPRFYDATGGEVRVFGKNVKDYSVMDLRKLIAIVPQSSHLFAGTVAQNMRWGNPNATDDDIRAALDAAGALDFVLAKEGGIEARVEARGANFSGGQRQRLAIARALIRKPRILILDDSFSALDFATDLKVRTNIAKLEDAPATVIISQRPSAVMDADSIVVLDDGEAAGIGTHDELIGTCEVYREIYATQYGGEN
ncbi:MAG: ABC transporter ATP-binding protein [Eubacteriales bacterium]